MRTAALPLLLLLLTACATTPSQRSPYRALGQEPGWTLTITADRITYVGDYGETRITAPRPAPRPTFNGHRYETPRLTVDVTHSLCHDAMSGHAYADTVMVKADGVTVRGCGGERRVGEDQ